MKVCIDARPVQNANRVRGIGVLINNLLSAMGQQQIEGDDFVLVTQRGREFAPYFDREEQLETFRLERPNRFNWIADQLFLPGLVKKSGADVFFATDFNSYLMPSKNVKVVAMAYDLIPFLFPEVMDGQPLPVQIGWRINFQKLKSADAVIAISEATKDDLVRLFAVAPKRIHVIHPGIDHDLFNMSNSGDATRADVLLDRYGITGRFLLYVGDSEWRKNLHRVLQALALLDGDIKLLLVGKRAKGDVVLQGWIRELGLEERVVTPGYVADEDLPPLYGAAEVFIFPSLYEGFGLPVIEAMACGCPVITSNVSSMPEIAGDAALLVDPVNVEQIAETINKILNEKGLQSALSEKGVRRAAFFSWEKSAQETIALIRSIAAQ